MKKLLATVIALNLWNLSDTVTADDDARAIVDKAAAAIGGYEQLKAHRAVNWKGTGTYHGMGQPIPYSGNYSAQWPSRFRAEIEGIFTIVVNGDKGWVNSPAGTIDLDAEQLAEQHRQLHTGWVASLAPLQNKEYKLTLLEEQTIDDRPAVGVRVSHDVHRDVSLYFDKETFLLIKHESIVTSMEYGDREILAEYFHREYKDVDGVPRPSKRLIKYDGDFFVESEISDMKTSDKLDDSVFAKPE